MPAPTGDVSGARGAFTATLTKTGRARPSRGMSFSGLTGNAVAAHIHQGATGTPGTVVLALCGPCQSPMSGTGDLHRGGARRAPSGRRLRERPHPDERGGRDPRTARHHRDLRDKLSARQERPEPKGNVRRATGTFTATVTKSGTAGKIAWRLRFSGLTGRAAAAHIHIGREGKPARRRAAAPRRAVDGARGTANLTPAVLARRERARVCEHRTRREPGR